MNTVEYILRPVSLSTQRSEDGSSSTFVEFALSAERRGKLLGGNQVQATIRSPEPAKVKQAPASDAVLCLPSGWLAIPRGRLAEQPSIARVIFESAVTDLEALIAWGTAQPPDTHESLFSQASDAFTEEFLAASIRAVGPDYWR